MIGINIKNAGIFIKPILNGKLVSKKKPDVKNPIAPNKAMIKPIAAALPEMTGRHDLVRLPVAEYRRQRHLRHLSGDRVEKYNPTVLDKWCQEERDRRRRPFRSNKRRCR